MTTLSRRRALQGALVLGAGALTGAGLGPLQAHAAPSGPDLRRAYERIKTPYKYGMVVPPPGNGHYDSPSVYRHNGRWYMLLVFYDSGRQGYETRLAVSDNLLNWSVTGTVLPFRSGWDTAQAAGYIALQDTTFGGGNGLRTHDGRYWLSYIGGASFGYEAGRLEIGMASTTDAASSAPWQRRDSAVLSPADGDVRWWEESKLYKSNIITDPERRLGADYVMYYNASGSSSQGNAGVEHIGMAVCDDMVNWRRYVGDPVVWANGGYENRVVGDPQVINVDGMWVMSFWARESAKLGTGVFNSFAGSYDLVNWTQWEGEKLITATVGYDQQTAHKPWIIHHDGVTYQFYSAIGDQGFGIGVATSRDLGAGAGATVAGASYTFVGDSAGEAVDGTVSHSLEPENRWTAYDSPNRSDWLMVEFPAVRSVSNVRLEIFNDGDGVRPPRSYVVEHWTGSEWLAVPGQSHSPVTPVGGTNTVTFATLSTSKVRVFFDHADPGAGVFSGVTELVIGGQGTGGGGGGGGAVALVNPDFSQGLTGWSTWPGTSGQSGDADFTEGGGRSGDRLTHYKSGAYEVYTSQTVTGLAAGTYRVRAWTVSGGGQQDCFLSVKDYGGGGELTQGIPGNGWPNWTLVEIDQILVSGGNLTIGVYSRAGDGGVWMSVDDVELVRV